MHGFWLPWQLVTVSGASMVPTLCNGDRVLVRHGAVIRTGDLVLATFASMPQRLVIKRVQRRSGTGWWLRSDNVFAGGDSETNGVAEVHARVVVRLPVSRWRLPVSRWRLTGR